MTLCKKGLHDLNDPVNAWIDSRGYRQCKPCLRSAQAVWRTTNRERLRDEGRARYVENRGEILARRLELKRECFDAQGGVCYCCGESKLAFLTLDHLNDDGGGRIRDKGGNSFYRWLRKRGYPQSLGLTVACFNCNSGRAVNGGVCPHAQEWDVALDHAIHKYGGTTS